MESGDHDDYIVKVDGSGRLSKRTRAHLRPIQVYDDVRPQQMPELPLPGPPATDDQRPPAPLQPNSPLPMTPATPTASSTPRTPRTDLGPPIPFPDLPPPQPVETPETAPKEGPPVTPPPSAEPAEQPTPPAPRRSERARRAPERLIMNCAVEGETP